MSNEVREAQAAELRILLDKAQNQPSAVTERDHERIAVLQEAARARAADASA